ncbi:MAG: hypothetical protein ACON4T_00065 [Synechococcus sp.]
MAGACVVAVMDAGDGLSDALAQRVVPKRQPVCPMGYVDTAKDTCSTLGLMTYTLQSSRDQPCSSGWVDVGGGYCRQRDKR